MIDKSASEARRSEFFRDVMGVDEETFRAWPAERAARVIVVERRDDRRIYRLEPAPGVSYEAGSFGAVSLGDLRRATASCRRGGGTFSVVDGVRLEGARPQAAVDVGGLQADPVNRHAVFQVASNFNALEATGPGVDIGEQRITRYTHDMTQGPAASISAAPGLILRHYFMFHDAGTEPGTWRQTPTRQVNMLSSLSALDVTPAGYVRLDRAVAGGIAPTDEDLAAIQVGVHRDVEVTHGYIRDADVHHHAAGRGQTITQVFTAAVDFTGTNRAHRADPVATQWAQTILDAAYEGTLRAAAAHGGQRVILTLVGGGVFANDPLWIAQAIERLETFIVDAGLDVVLIGYHAIPPAIRGRLRAMAARTGGRYAT